MASLNLVRVLNNRNVTIPSTSKAETKPEKASSPADAVDEFKEDGDKKCDTAITGIPEKDTTTPCEVKPNDLECKIQENLKSLINVLKSIEDVLVEETNAVISEPGLAKNASIV